MKRLEGNPPARDASHHDERRRRQADVSSSIASSDGTSSMATARRNWSEESDRFAYRRLATQKESWV